MSGLTTHILDTYSGKPANGVKVELLRCDAHGQMQLVLQTTSNAQGRCELASAAEAATYMIRFYIGDYFKPVLGDAAAFLDCVPVVFNLAHPSQHYHVPLVVSPWAYSTYRGS